MSTINLSPPAAALKALLGNPLAVAIIDRQLRCTHVNAAFAHRMERELNALIFRPVREAPVRLADQSEPALRRVLGTGEAIDDFELRGAQPNAGRVWSEHQ